MRKTFGLLILLVVTSPCLFAAELPVSTMTEPSVTAKAPLTLQQGLDDAAKNLVERWITDAKGQKRRMACNFQCTQWCDEQRRECILYNPWPYTECNQQWNICMCENQCCTGGCP